MGLDPIGPRKGRRLTSRPDRPDGVGGEDRRTPAPPWAGERRWRGINRRLATLAVRHRDALSGTIRRARDLEKRLVRIDAAFRRLCPATCSRCPDPCCLRAKVWFDLRDLIFLHLTEQPAPPAQPIRAMMETCRYLGPRGCRLHRLSRPWICTWYLCPTQTARLRRNGDPENLVGMIDAVKSVRKEMERGFRAAVGRVPDRCGFGNDRITLRAG